MSAHASCFKYTEPDFGFYRRKHVIELANKEYTTYVAACTVCYRIVDVVTVRARWLEWKIGTVDFRLGPCLWSLVPLL